MNLLKQNHIKYGLLMAGITLVCLLLMEATGNNESFDKSPFATFFIFIAPLIVWFLGIREKKKSQKNKITFKQGLSTGFKMAATYALISPFIFLLYYLLFNPSIVTHVGEAYGLQNASTPVIIAVDMATQVISATVFGTIYAAIIAFVLKTKK